MNGSVEVRGVRSAQVKGRDAWREGFFRFPRQAYGQIYQVCLDDPSAYDGFLGKGCPYR